jgi:hypothetical protein
MTEYVCSSQCGGPGQPCCQNGTCRNNGCCMLGWNATGDIADVCVESPTCGCTAGQCTTCGTANQACCAGGSCQWDQGYCSGIDGGICSTKGP